jgi:nitric oxide reductase large subunit
MQRSTVHHHHQQEQHGVCTGIFLAVGVVAIGFLLQADLANFFNHGGQRVLAGALVVAALGLLVFRCRSSKPR